MTGSTAPSNRVALKPLIEEHLLTVVLMRTDRARPAATRTDSWNSKQVKQAGSLAFSRNRNA